MFYKRNCMKDIKSSKCMQPLEEKRSLIMAYLHNYFFHFQEKRAETVRQNKANIVANQTASSG